MTEEDAISVSYGHARWRRDQFTAIKILNVLQDFMSIVALEVVEVE